MRFYLPSEVEAQIRERSRLALPEEACGLILGTRQADVVRIETQWPSANLADARVDRFRLDPAAQLAAERHASAEGLSVLGCWHSHPRGEATPSLLDLRGIPVSWLLLIVAPPHEPASGRVRVHRQGESGHSQELERVLDSSPRPRTATPLRAGQP